MRLNSVGMRKWTLWGAWPLAVFNPLHAAFTACGMLSWMLLGLVLSDKSPLPYKRRIGPWREGARAFLSLAVGLATLSIMEFLACNTGIYGSALGNIYAFGVPFFCQSLTALMQRNHMPPRLAALYGCGFMIFSLLLL